MKRLFLLLPALCAVGCFSTIVDPAPEVNDIVSIDGQLRLDVTDKPTIGGVLWALPSASTGPSMVSVTQTMYGSLCRYAVAGHADVTDTAITIRLEFAERLTSCTTEIRALTYNAQVTALTKKQYDLRVIDVRGTAQDTLLVQRVTLP